MRIFGIIVLIAGGIAFLVVGSCALGIFSWGVGRTIDVAKQELDPGILLKKYEWFKDASAQLDKKIADIQVYESRFKQMDITYKKIPRDKWPRDDREQYNLWQTEVAGVKASFNSLAAEYNSQMTKINWRFTNIGDLPKGADKPLPREYKTYIGG